jgi:hypothetical protein
MNCLRIRRSGNPIRESGTHEGRGLNVFQKDQEKDRMHPERCPEWSGFLLEKMRRWLFGISPTKMNAV